jgi:phenylalanyl-tRNA synthetase alpha chain
MDELNTIARAVEAALRDARTPEAVEEVRRAYLGRKGTVTRLFDDLPKTPASERPARGRQLNELRRGIEGQVAARLALVSETDREARQAAEAIDVTMPGRRPRLGRLHLLSQTMAEVRRIFHGMGFEIVEGPEVESDEFNFERLNMGRDHPARDAQDSFYLTDDLLLRTHTTVVDAHIMVDRRPPMRILTTGRCYRRDAPDWKRMPVFHQVDGFMVGESITMANLKGVLSSFALELFGPATRTRFVPGYFPFTEPSAEMYVHFNDQWMELGGCGMFHPRVLEMAGIDPQRYSAFAFGLGVDRQVMVRYGVPDIRLFWDNDLRLLEQF